MGEYKTVKNELALREINHAEIDKDQLQKEFNIDQLRQSETWADFIESNISNDGIDPFDSFIEKARSVGLSHTHAHSLLRILFREFKLHGPGLINMLAKVFEYANLGEVSSDELNQHIKDCVNEMENSLNEIRAQGRDPTPREAIEFVEKLQAPLLVLVQYGGPIPPTLGTVKGYQKLKLLALPGTSRLQEPEFVESAQPATKKLELPDIRNIADHRFTAIPPPKKGEPMDMTRLRILLEWVETEVGQTLQDYLLVAMNKGIARLSNFSDSYQSPFQSSLHQLMSGVEEKFQLSMPYLVYELCINHGKTAWELISEYDASSVFNKDSTQFTVAGLYQNIVKIVQNQRAFEVELEYMRDLLPWILVGKVHPQLTQQIRAEFANKEYILEPTGKFAQHLLHSIRTAVRYLDQLLEHEKHDDQEVWDALGSIENQQLKDSLRTPLISFFQSTTLADCRKSSASVLLLSHPDRAQNVPGLENFVRIFIAASLKKRKALKDN